MSQIHPTGPEAARILLVGEFPHEQDLLRGVPFVGGPGYELTKMLKEANIFRESCFITMVCRSRAPGARTEGLVAETKKAITSRHKLFKGKWVLPEVVEGVALLKAEIERVKPNVVVTFGNLALWALTSEWGANSWRSSVMESDLVPGQKVVPTISPAQVLLQWPMRALLVHDLKRAQRQSPFPEVRRPKYNLVIRPDFKTAVEHMRWLIQKAQDHLDSTGERLPFGGDIETRAGHISCIAFADSPTSAICIPFMDITKPEGYWSLEEEAELVWLCCHLMARVKLIGQNWNYDAQYILKFWKFLCPAVEDTMIQQHSCFSNMEKGLAFLSSMYCEDHLYWKDDRTAWEKGLEGASEDQYWIYNCTDAMRTLAINSVLTQVIRSLKLEEVNRFQQRLSDLVLKAMTRGVRVDQQARAEFSLQMLSEVAERNAWMTEVIGHEINIKSPLQMQQFFYGEMAMSPIRDRKTKNLTTNDEALHRLAERDPLIKPITRKIAELRTLGVFHSTFVQAPLDSDGRIRTSFNVAGTDTYRFASKKNAFGGGCNFQNVPKGGETEDGGLELPNVRRLFIPDPGMTMFDTDLDSADLRIVAWESDCKWLKEQFRTGQKPYVSMMKEYYQDDSITKHHKSYPMFKSTAHGSNYLGTADGMAPRIGLDPKQVQKLQNWYFNLCPEVVKWQNDVKKQVEGRRYIQNVFGYRMYIFDRIQQSTFNEAVAWIPQSSVACLINRVWDNLDRNMPECEILIQVHDSLVGQFETHLGDWAERRIIEESQVVLPYDDPLIIPMGIATSSESWGHCK